MKLSGAMNRDGKTSPRTKLASLPARERWSCEKKHRSNRSLLDCSEVLGKRGIGRLGPMEKWR